MKTTTTKQTATTVIQQLANLPLVVAGSRIETFRAIRALQEEAQRLTRQLHPEPRQTSTHSPKENSQ